MVLHRHLCDNEREESLGKQLASKWWGPSVNFPEERGSEDGLNILTQGHVLKKAPVKLLLQKTAFLLGNLAIGNQSLKNV